MMPTFHLPIWLCHDKLGAGYGVDPSYSCKDYSGPGLACCELPPSFPSPPAYLPDRLQYSSLTEDVALCSLGTLLPLLKVPLTCL